MGIRHTATPALILLATILLLSGTLFGIRPRTGQKSKLGSVLFILDASGSMTANFGGVSRMAAARSYLMEKIGRLKPLTPVGLVAYGNGILGCDSARLYSPIMPGRHKQVVRQASGMFPAGSTPLAATLRMVSASIIPSHPATTVFIISDGAESCGGDPVREAAKLRARGAKIHVIGLSVKGHASKQLNAIARAGNGSYRIVRNQLDLARAYGDNPEPEARGRWNRYVEHKWDVEQKENRRAKHTTKVRKPRQTDERPERVGPDLPFVLTGVKQKGVRGDMRVVVVDFRFRQPAAGNYQVSLQALPYPQRFGPGGRLRAGDALFGFSSVSFYNAASGQGAMEMEIPVALFSYRRIFVQGELFRINEVPGSVYISNSLLVR